MTCFLHNFISVKSEIYHCNWEASGDVHDDCGQFEKITTTCDGSVERTGKKGLKELRIKPHIAVKLMFSSCVY